MRMEKNQTSNNYRHSNMQLLLLKTIGFCVFFAAAALAVAFFLPAKMPSPQETLGKLITGDNFFAEAAADLSENIFSPSNVVLQHSKRADKGLELYRQARSKTAVEWFYINITGNKDIAYAILQEANKNDIPLSLAFALAYVESRFNPKAANKNTNSSIDRGLFQLNSFSFPHLSETDFYDPAVSAKYGMKHLRFCLDLGEEEVTALAMYNAGANRVRRNNTPRSTLNYVDAIMRYRSGLESTFSNEIARLYQPETPKGVKLAMIK